MHICLIHMDINFRKILTGRFFDETKDVLKGPQWAAAVIVVGALILAFTILGAAFSEMGSEREYRLLTAALASWIVISGALWNMGLKARSMNNLIVATVLVAILSLYRAHYFS